jgi:trehalose synthase
MSTTSSPIELVEVRTLSPDRFAEVLDEDGMRDLAALADRARKLLDGRTLWCINSTAKGGGVAEMLESLLAYTAGAGVQSRWAVISGEQEFFRVTKRIHNRLHGAEGDGGALGDAERPAYEAALEPNHAPLADLVAEGDVVLVHDPQPAGLVAGLKEQGAVVVWRLHIGADEVDDGVREVWDFLRPYIEPADAWVFSRDAFAWEGLDPERTATIAPSIDVFAPKNEDIPEEEVDAILVAAGLLGGEAGAPERAIEHRADVLEEAPLPPELPFVLQVSRWDALKDHRGVLKGFAEHVAPHCDAHLVLAGPSVEGVSDDPEGAEELERVQAAWKELPDDVRARVHVASLPMDDHDENAWMVNALQRRARVVVQKSLAEGFGLTVSEAMWKSRPVVASAVGGIQEQIVSGETGELVGAHDLEAFGAAVTGMLTDRERADRMGAAARERVLEQFTGVRHLREWVDLLEPLLGD